MFSVSNNISFIMAEERLFSSLFSFVNLATIY